jgi:hypothetical protein
MLIPAIISVLIALPLSLIWVYLIDKNKKNED